MDAPPITSLETLLAAILDLIRKIILLLQGLAAPLEALFS